MSEIFVWSRISGLTEYVKKALKEANSKKDGADQRADFALATSPLVGFMDKYNIKDARIGSLLIRKEEDLDSTIEPDETGYEICRRREVVGSQN